MRLSQAQFAEAIRATGNAVGAPNQCTKRLVQKWENGEHTACRSEYLTVLQAVTGLSARELGFRLPADYARISGAAVDSSGQVDASGTGSSLSGIAPHCTDAMIDESMDRLSHALNNPSTVDARTAHFVEMATARLFDLEHHTPARLLSRTVDRHMSMVTALLTAARAEKVRRSLTVSAGTTVLLAGWLAFDRGYSSASNEFYAAAISAAQGTADDGLFAATLTCQSYAAARQGDISTAWQLAHTAASRTPEDACATAWTNTRVAFYAAQLGERNAAEAAFSSALEVADYLPEPKPGDGGQPWTRCFDRARLLSSVALTAALLGHPDAIVYVTRAVDALSPAKVKSRAVVLAEAALTAAIVCELKLCLDYGSAAAVLASDMDVSLALDLLYDVVQAVLPHSEADPIRELLPQLVLLPRSIDAVKLGLRAEIAAPVPSR